MPIAAIEQAHSFPLTLPLLAAAACLVAHDAPARALALARNVSDTSLASTPRPARAAAWAAELDALDVVGPGPARTARIRLYDDGGEIDPGACAAFEEVASRGADTHPLAARLEQIVFKAAYHFRAHRLIVVSGWRERASRHGTGEALDFKLPGVSPRELASYLRHLGHVGVGLYTHPNTQFVHVDVRSPSYYWVDASPPGVHWREHPLHDRAAARRDAEYEPQADLPIE